MKDDTIQKVDLKSLIIGILVTMVIVAFMLIATMGGSQDWEYKTIRVYRINDPELNKLAAGWEVIGYTHFEPSSNVEYNYYVLKRPKPKNWKFWK